MARILDIAKKSGFSRSTVSRVLNNDENVKDSTREKILQTMQDMGYVPSATARSLRLQHTNILGVVIPDPLVDIFAPDSVEYYNVLIQSISQTLQLAGYAMLLWLSNPDDGEDGLYERVLQNHFMDGLIVVSSVKGERYLINKLHKAEIPYVLMSRPLRRFPDANYVTIDNIQASREIIHFLYERGCRRIATIIGNLANIDAVDRLEGYQLGLQDVGLEIDPKLIRECNFTEEAASQQFMTLVDQKPDALFAGNDIIAFGAMRAAQDAGYKIPEDIKVVGFDDLERAKTSTPPLTTMRQPIAERASTAANLLIDILEGVLDAPQSILLPTELMIRESTGG